MNATRKSMARRLMVWLGVAALAAGFAGSASAAATGITNTKHNLSKSGTGTNHVTGDDGVTGTDQICVFCHTPHGSAGGGAPIWNRTLSADNSYTTYSNLNSSTLDGQVLSTVGSTSLACLSCHDGSQAMDSMLNAPGSGNPSTAGYTWAGSDTITGVAKLGTDLSNDHPIGIEYCGGGLSSSADGVFAGSCNDADFVTSSDTTTSDGRTGKVMTKHVNGSPVFWVNLDANTQRNKNDLQLYTRTFTAGARPSVECGSCHDPHMEALATGAVNFMRVTTAGSKICLSCHIK